AASAATTAAVSPVLSLANEVTQPFSSLLDVPPAATGVFAAIGIAGNASCAPSSYFEGPTSLRMAFSVTPNWCAIARLLMPWVFKTSRVRGRFEERRRRPRCQPVYRLTSAA